MNIYKGYTDTPKGQIHYRSCGKGDEVLVLVHATSDSSTMWESVLPKLGDLGYNAIAFDLPGYGNSDFPPEKPDGAEYARRINEAVHIIGVDRYSVIGQHTGATVAAWMAVHYPQNVRRLVLRGYPMVNDKWRSILANDKPRVFDKEGTAIQHHWVRRWKMSDMGIPEGSGNGLVDPVDSMFTSAMGIRTMIALLQAGTDWYFGHHAVAATDHADLARRIIAPTLIICGPRDPLWKESQAAVSHFKDSRFAEVEGAGVDLVDEYPDKFCEIVDKFIRN